MKIAFHILAILICGVAAYFSLTLKEKFESQQNTRFETIDRNRNVTQSADETEADIVTQTAVLNQAKLDQSTAAANLESLEATGRTIAGQVRDLNSALETQKSEITRLEASIQEILKKLAAFGEDQVTPDGINQKLAELKQRRDDLDAKRIELEELVSAGERNLAIKRAEADALTQRNVSRNAALRLNATDAVITAVNHDWGFVLIGAGSNSGFAPQTSMVVQRDGRVIGRIRPSAIEPTQTIAEIMLDSLAPGVRLQPGDRVIYPKPMAN
jgi:hypothetical protein